MIEKDKVRRSYIGILAMDASFCTEHFSRDRRRSNHSERLRKALHESCGPPRGLNEQSLGVGGGLSVPLLPATHSLEQISWFHPISSTHTHTHTHTRPRLANTPTRPLHTASGFHIMEFFVQCLKEWHKAVQTWEGCFLNIWKLCSDIYTAE